MAHLSHFGLCQTSHASILSRVRSIPRSASRGVSEAKRGLVNGSCRALNLHCSWFQGQPLSHIQGDIIKTMDCIFCFRIKNDPSLGSPRQGRSPLTQPDPLPFPSCFGTALAAATSWHPPRWHQAGLGAMPAREVNQTTPSAQPHLLPGPLNVLWVTSLEKGASFAKMFSVSTYTDSLPKSCLASLTRNSPG